MTMFRKSWTWRCQTNDVDTCYEHGVGLTQLETGNYLQLSLHIVYVLSLDLRLSHVLEMWIDLLWGYQTLHRDRVVIKVAFGFVLKHAARHDQSRWDFPLST